MEGLRIGNKKTRFPVIQGGMGIGISLGRLAGTVAKEGGAGVISAAQIGFREPDFEENTKGANLRAIRKEYEKAREISPDGLIGFNLMVAMRHYEEYARAAAEAGADFIVSGAGLPTDLPEIVNGYDVKLAPIVSTEKSAKVILKYWDKKHGRIPDFLVIEGPEAGGHLGFDAESLKKYEKSSVYTEEVKRILDIVKEYEEKYGQKISTALGGGIDSPDAVRAALSLGADAVQAATCFVTTEECDADIRYKQAYIDAGKEDIVIVKSPVGMPGRAIKNRMMERVMCGEKIPHSPCHRCLSRCNPAEIPYCITDALIHAAKGEIKDALLFCGAGAYRAERIKTVREVINELFLSDNG